MNLKNAVTVKAARSVLQFKKSSPRLMFGVGIVSMVGTVVLSSKATLKLDETLKEHELLRADNTKENKRALALEIGKLYAPAIGMGLVSVGCLTGSHIVLSKRNAALTAAYAALDQAYRKYRDEVREQLGDEKERQIAFGIDERSIVRDPESGVALAGKSVGGRSPYAKLFDSSTSLNFNRGLPHANRTFLLAQQNYLNDMLISRGHVFLNEVYEALGLEHTEAGAVVGWFLHGGGDDYIDFGVFNRPDEGARAFVNGFENAVWLDFNVDGVIYQKLRK